MTQQRQVDRGSVRRRIELIGVLALAWRPTWPRMRGMVRSMVTSYLALGVTLWLLPGVQASGPASVALLAVVVILVGGVLRPVLLSLTVLLGSFGLLAVGVLAQAIILGVALVLTPGFEIGSPVDVLLASWVAAIVAAIVNWLFDASSEDAFLAQVLGRAVRVAGRQPQGDHPLPSGVLIVQLDGVSEPLLRQAITAGAMPTVSRWLRSGGHTLREWHTGLPATTPAGQAVLLHGDTKRVPSFRWYEKERARLMVANRPADAAEIERRMSDGRGLLADGGVSVSNLFSGDAPTRLLTMSDAKLPTSNRGVATFATARTGLLRSLVVFVGQMITEWHQSRRQRLRNVLPRVRRGGVFVLLRGVTTVVLRDLNVSIVAEQMALGAPTIFVDFVDYDEVAHHAGPSRPESMRTLDGLDRVLRFFEQVAAEVPRRYEVVLVSDHGQAQGATFSQQSEVTLHELVASLTGPTGTDSTPVGEDSDSRPVEQWGPANVLLTGAARSENVIGGATRGLIGRRVERSAPEDQLAVALDRPRRGRGGTAAPTADLLVAASGSLAHLYLTDAAGRVDRPRIDERYPRLVQGLAGHPEVGAVMVRDGQQLVVLGSDGWRELRDGTAVGGAGEDPLAAYGEHAAADLIALDVRDHVGDLVVLGRYDPALGEVTAFEELVGSHGGLGGLQTSALLVHPASWDPLPPGRLDGREVFHALENRLRVLGLRRHLPVVSVISALDATNLPT